MFFLSFLTIFLYTQGFCVESDKEHESDVFVKKTTRRGGPSRCHTYRNNVLAYLSQRMHTPCYEIDLMEFCPRVTDKRRDLYGSILMLREQGHNIIHNASAETFTLAAGVRQRATGCYKERLWGMLDNASVLYTRSLLLALSLSDEGYDPTVAWVESLQVLKKILDTGMHLGKTFWRRKKMWAAMQEENCMLTAQGFSSHVKVQELVTSEDVNCMNHCWDFYTKVLHPMSGFGFEKKEKLRRYMEQRPEGVESADLEGFLKDEGLQSLGLWGCVGALMQTKGSQVLDYKKGKFFWNNSPQCGFFQFLEVSDVLFLLVSERHRPEEGMCLDDMLFALYKRGFFNINAQEVESILDILAVTDLLPPGHAGGRDVLNAWEKKDAESQEDQSLSPPIATRVALLTRLHKSGILQRFLQKKPMDLIGIIKVKMAEGDVPDRKRKNVHGGPEDSSVQCKQFCYDKAFQSEDIHEWFTQSTDAPIDVLGGAGASTQTVSHEGSQDDNPGVQRRKQLLQCLEHHKDRPVSEGYFLEKFRKMWVNAESLLEDAVRLIFEEHNVQYKDGAYTLLSQDFTVPLIEKGSWQHFLSEFGKNTSSKMSLANKAYLLYDRGFRNIPMSTVALYQCVLNAMKRAYGITDRKMEVLLDMKQEVFCANQKLSHQHYETFFPGWGVEQRDIDVLHDSLVFSEEGRIFLKMNMENRGKVMNQSALVLRHMQRVKNQPCSMQALKSVVLSQDRSNRRRDVIRAVVSLRGTGKNIIHDGAGNFTLIDGVREIKPGYQRVLWDRMVSGKAHNNNMLDTFLSLSDEGFFPCWSEYKYLWGLYHLVFFNELRALDPIRKRKKMWDLVVKERRVKSYDYYLHQEGCQDINLYDFKFIKACFDLYTEYVCKDRPSNLAGYPCAEQQTAGVENYTLALGEGMSLRVPCCRGYTIDSELSVPLMQPPFAGSVVYEAQQAAGTVEGSGGDCGGGVSSMAPHCVDGAFVGGQQIFNAEGYTLSPELRMPLIGPYFLTGTDALDVVQSAPLIGPPFACSGVRAVQQTSSANENLGGIETYPLLDLGPNLEELLTPLMPRRLDDAASAGLYLEEQ